MLLRHELLRELRRQGASESRSGTLDRPSHWEDVLPCMRRLDADDGTIIMTKTDRNEMARLRTMGLFNSGTFPSVEAATRAFVAWAANANASGKDLAGMAVLVDEEGDTVKATLAWRRYWRNLAIRSGNPALYRAFSEPDEPNTLRVFVASADGDSSFALSLNDLRKTG